MKEILNQLIDIPAQHQIQIDFDLGKKIFILQIPLYRSKDGLPQAIKGYVAAREGKVFKPHATSFLKKDEEIWLFQEIPFQWGFRPAIRKDILDFLQLAKRCHRMFYEIALEEKYKTIFETI